MGVDFMSSAEHIAERVVDSILARRLGPGTKLGEADLGSLFGCSRTVVREALTKLSDRGIVQPSARRGWFVAEPTPRDVEEAFQARLIIETGILDRTQPLNDKALAALDKHIEQQRRALAGSDGGLRSLLLGDFHVVLARLCGHELLADMLKSLTVRTTLSAMRYQSEGDAERSFAEHEAIAASLRRHDMSEAATLMSQHLSTWRIKLPIPADGDRRAGLAAALRPVARN
jgi:DNA-binding GntR family transcriptional regulator